MILHLLSFLFLIIGLFTFYQSKHIKYTYAMLALSYLLATIDYIFFAEGIFIGTKILFILMTLLLSTLTIIDFRKNKK